MCGHGNSRLMPIADFQLPNWKRRGGKIVRVYIQVQKVHVLYLFFGNPGIFEVRLCRFERICKGGWGKGSGCLRFVEIERRAGQDASHASTRLTKVGRGDTREG